MKHQATHSTFAFFKAAALGLGLLALFRRRRA
jgi:hypothetical protein